MQRPQRSPATPGGAAAATPRRKRPHAFFRAGSNAPASGQGHGNGGVRHSGDVVAGHRRPAAAARNPSYKRRTTASFLSEKPATSAYQSKHPLSNAVFNRARGSPAPALRQAQQQTPRQKQKQRGSSGRRRGSGRRKPARQQQQQEPPPGPVAAEPPPTSRPPPNPQQLALARQLWQAGTISREQYAVLARNAGGGAQPPPRAPDGGGAAADDGAATATPVTITTDNDTPADGPSDDDDDGDTGDEDSADGGEEGGDDDIKTVSTMSGVSSGYGSAESGSSTDDGGASNEEEEKEEKSRVPPPQQEAPAAAAAAAGSGRKGRASSASASSAASGAKGNNDASDGGGGGGGGGGDGGVGADRATATTKEADDASQQQQRKEDPRKWCEAEVRRQAREIEGLEEDARVLEAWVASWRANWRAQLDAQVRAFEERCARVLDGAEALMVDDGPGGASPPTDAGAPLPVFMPGYDPDATTSGSDSGGGGPGGDPHGVGDARDRPLTVAACRREAVRHWNASYRALKQHMRAHFAEFAKAQAPVLDEINGTLARLRVEQERRIARRRLGVVRRTWRRAKEGVGAFALWLGLPPLPPPRRFGFRWLLKTALKLLLFALALVVASGLVLVLVYPDVPDEL